MDNNSISDTLDTLMILLLYPSNSDNYENEQEYDGANEQEYDGANESDYHANESEGVNNDVFNQLLNSTLYDKFSYKYIITICRNLLVKI
jgi:hypothetical protein